MVDVPVRNYYPYLNRAVVVINGAPYHEWESVYVRKQAYGNPLNSFRFTCSEQEPMGRDWAAMRIVPGDSCEIFLDGILAITGEVITRQVFYSATQHVVEIQGQGKSGKSNQAAVVTKTGEFLKQPIQSLVSSVMAPIGVSVGTGVGSLSNFKFPRATVQPGETIWSFAERHARASNTVFTESSQGTLLLHGEGGALASPRVVEGQNILEGREVIHSTKSVGGGKAEAAGGDFSTTGQAPGNDDSWGADPTHGRHDETKPITTDFSPGYLPKRILSEIPAWANSMLKQRGGMERNVADTLQIWVTVTLLSWQRNATAPPGGGLWEPMETVVVWSPMLVMYNRPLILKAVTFSQDNNTGTRSTLELVNAAAMGFKAQE